VPELFHHQERFFGCLTLRRVRRITSGPDLAAYDALANTLLHRVAFDAEYDLLIATQAFDAGSSARCPALGDDGGCAVHRDRKPAVCRVVPLDALVPDALQHQVLAERAQDALDWGADCIAPGIRAGFEPLTRRLAVVNDSARQALRAHRESLADERRFWGKAVFRVLEDDLFRDAARVRALPSVGFFALSLAPVLMVIGVASERCRRRTLAFLDAQLWLARRTLERASRDGDPQDDALARLAAFARTHAELRAALAASPPRPTPETPEQRELEHWLGLPELGSDPA